ncbi:dynein axonemal heavy chain 11 isoform 1-T3 [Acridotheres tristis]
MLKGKTHKTCKVAEAKENAAQDNTTREPPTLTARRASIPYSGSISLGSVNSVYQLSLKLSHLCSWESEVWPSGLEWKIPDRSAPEVSICVTVLSNSSEPTRSDLSARIPQPENPGEDFHTCLKLLNRYTVGLT